jgi:hypothetical protein
MSERERKDGAYLVIPSTGTRIQVPDDPEREDEVLLTHPEFQARLARARHSRAEGRGVPADELYARLGYVPPAERPATGRQGQKGTPNGRIPLRVPLSLHRALVERARAEGISLNQLIVAYVSRMLGHAEAGGDPDHAVGGRTG